MLDNKAFERLNERNRLIDAVTGEHQTIEEQCQEAKLARESAETKENSEKRLIGEEERKTSLMKKVLGGNPDAPTPPDTVIARIVVIDDKIVTATVLWNNKTVLVDRRRCITFVTETDNKDNTEIIQKVADIAVGDTGELSIDPSWAYPEPKYILIMK